MKLQAYVLIGFFVILSGCGKDVERSSRPVIQPQQNPVQSTALQTQAGICKDPIQTNYKQIERFSDIALAAGKYELSRFDAVGTATQGGDAPTALTAISVGEGLMKSGGVVEYHQVCSDLNAMPSGQFTWSAEAPVSFTAENGTLDREVRVVETVFGPSVMSEGQNTPRASISKVDTSAVGACKTAANLIGGNGCEPAVFYQIDANTIGILRIVDSEVDGMKTHSKIFAQYVLSGGGSPAPRLATPAPKKVMKEKKNGGQGATNGGQGAANGGQGSSST